MTFTGGSSGNRDVVAADYGILWQVLRNFSLSEQIDYSDVHQPGTSNISAGATLETPGNPNETINYSGALTPGAKSTVEGSANGTPLPDYFGQKLVINNLTATWDASARTTFSLTYRYRTHLIAEGIPNNAPLAVAADTNGTVTIDENGGIFNAAFRPTQNWDINGSAEVSYADNAFTPVAPRQLQHYRVHTIYRPKTWATISGAFNDLERHNNTNNTGTAPLDGPLDHVDHTRVGSVGAQIFPNEHYGLDLDYAYSDVSTATNICYLGGGTPTQPGAATPSGAACPSPTANRGGGYDFGPVKDFMDAPTQTGSAAISLSPVKQFHSDIGYRINSVNGSRFYNDARDVAGSLVSTYQSPFVNVAWTERPGLVWKAEYNFYGYGEGGPSGATYCATANPGATTPAAVVPCNSPSLGGAQTGLTISPAGETAPRNFHANNVTLGLHYEF